MRIGELARRGGVTVDTLRYYERRGLVTARRQASGYRSYDETALADLRLVRWAKSLGFTLREARDLVGIARDHQRGRRRGIQARAAAKIAEVDVGIGQLSALRQRLEAVARCSCEGACPILEEVARG